jgi:hypothetical protein
VVRRIVIASATVDADARMPAASAIAMIIGADHPLIEHELREDPVLIVEVGPAWSQPGRGGNGHGRAVISVSLSIRPCASGCSANASRAYCFIFAPSGR